MKERDPYPHPFLHSPGEEVPLLCVSPPRTCPTGPAPYLESPVLLPEPHHMLFHSCNYTHKQKQFVTSTTWVWGRTLKLKTTWHTYSMTVCTVCVCYLRSINICSIHKWSIIVVFHKVTTFGGVIAVLWLLAGDLHCVRWVVEVNYVDIKHQHSRARDLNAWYRARESES